MGLGLVDELLEGLLGGGEGVALRDEVRVDGREAVAEVVELEFLRSEAVGGRVEGAELGVVEDRGRGPERELEGREEVVVVERDEVLARAVEGRRRRGPV